MTEDIYTVQARDDLYCKLIFQEAKFWRSHPENLTQEDFSAIVSRRGFNEEEVKHLRGLLDFWEVKWS